MNANPSSPFQHLYSHLKTKDPLLFQAMDRIFSIQSSSQATAQNIQSNVSKKVSIADSGLDWVANTLYPQYALVKYSGKLYVRLFPGRTEVLPSLDTHNWAEAAGSGGGGVGTVTHTSTALTLDQPVFGNGTDDIKIGSKSGNTNEVATISGSLTSGHVASFDASGNIIDSGSPPGIGTVTHTAGSLTLDQPVFGAGGADTKVGTKSGNTDEVATISGALTSGHAIKIDASGNLIDSGSPPSVGTVTNTGGSLTADLPLFGSGGVDIKTGTKSGNTDEVATISGSLTPGHAIVSDANGNLVDFGAAPFSGLPDPGANGIVVRTAANTDTARSLTAGSTKIVVTNGSGVAANPSVDLGSVAASDLTNNVTGSGLVVLQTSPTILTPTVASFANAPHNHQNSVGGGLLTESSLSLSDVTTDNVSISAHGFAPKAPNTSAKYLDGTGSWSTPTGESGGGGVLYVMDGFSELADPAPTASVGTESDEFTGSSLNAKWTLVSNTVASLEYNNTWKSHIRVKFTGDQLYTIKQPMTRSGDFSAAIKLRGFVRSNFEEIGIYFYNASETDGIRGVLNYESGNSGMGYSISSKDSGTWTYNRQRVSAIWANPNNFVPSALYLLVQRISNIWYVGCTPGGIVEWWGSSGYSKTFTLDHVMINLANATSTRTHYYGIDWFRTDWLFLY